MHEYHKLTESMLHTITFFYVKASVVIIITFYHFISLTNFGIFYEDINWEKNSCECSHACFSFLFLKMIKIPFNKKETLKCTLSILYSFPKQ